MLFPISRNVFRWSTPDPQDNWMMIGHLVISGNEIVLIDPPLVPGLLDAIRNLGKPSSVMLTTIDHVRASRYLQTTLGVKLYVPKQTRTTNMDPEEMHAHTDIESYNLYDEGDAIPASLKAFRMRPFAGAELPRYDELAILTATGELLVGDVAEGTSDGRVLTGVEFFVPNPETETVNACFGEIERVVRTSRARTLLSSHGQDIIGTLQEAVSARK